MNPSLSILIPVRDEQQNIQIISEEIKQKIACSNYEILFINDFSEDQTEDGLIKLSQTNDKVVYYNNNKKGLGGALDLGIQKSKGKYICIMMSDCSDTVEDLNLYYSEISSNNYDAIFGSRFIKGSTVKNYPFSKYILNRIANNIISLIFFVRYNDFTNAFKIYKKSTLLKLFPLVSDSYNIFLELPLKIICRKYNYKIIPISWNGRKKGITKFNFKELRSKYIFTMLYCLLEKILLKK